MQFTVIWKIYPQRTFYKCHIFSFFNICIICYVEQSIFNPEINKKNNKKENDGLKSSSETIEYKKSIFVIPTPCFHNYWII